MTILSKITGASTSILLLVAQLPQLIASLKAFHGKALSPDEKAAIVQFTLAALGTVEGISGTQIAADTDVSAAASAVIDAVEAFHTIVTTKHLNAPPAA
jgi:hypothetical protein